MERILLTNKETRIKDMEALVNSVANSILDESGDELFARYLQITHHIHRYSLGNQILMMVQAPTSRLVASVTAFGKMAKEQGHAPVVKHTNEGKAYEEYVHIDSGNKAVWIWGAPRQYTSTREVEDEENGGTKKVSHTFNRFYPATVYCVEGIHYSDTDTPFEVPNFVTPVEDLNLYEAALAFAAHKGITVAEENLGGAAGVSKGGSIATQAGQTWQENVPVLLHEIAHELLHPLHGKVTRHDLPREVKESEAEATCAVILQHFGHGIGPQAMYLRNWKCKPEDVIASMTRIATAAAEVVDFIEKTTTTDAKEERAA